MKQQYYNEALKTTKTTTKMEMKESYFLQFKNTNVNIFCAVFKH